MGSSSNAGSTYGANRLTFGQKTKKKATNNMSIDLDEDDYENLCLEVTKRLINNRKEE